MSEMSTSPTMRFARRLWPRRSALVRPVDWVEAALLVAVLTVGLVLLPVALVLGSETYASTSEQAEEQARARHPATAILEVDAPPVSEAGGGELAGGETSNVQARWQVPDGTARVGPVRADHGLRAGSEVPIWLDPTGNLVDPPLSAADATLAGFAAATVLWTAGVALLAGVFLAVRAGLNRRRCVAWQREWARVEPGWSHRA